MVMDMERGPRYQAYSQLRETKLRMNHLKQQQQYQVQEEEEEYETQQPKIPTPPRKQVKFQFQPGLLSSGTGRTKGSSSSSFSSSLLAQSVPDFSAVLRKENRKPVNNKKLMELTPPPKGKTFSKPGYGVLSASRGSHSANAAEKKRCGGGGGGGILTARKSYANIHELRSFSYATENSEIRGRNNNNNSRVVGKRTVLRCREV